MSKIIFNKEKLKEFKKMYEETKDGEVFVFEGHKVLKEYAKYLIQYIEMKFAKEL